MVASDSNVTVPVTNAVASESNVPAPSTNPVAPVAPVVQPVSKVVQPVTNAVATLADTTLSVPAVLVSLPTSTMPVADVITMIQDMLISVTDAVVLLAQVPSDLYSLLVAGMDATAVDGGSWCRAVRRSWRRACAPNGAFAAACPADVPHRCHAVAWRYHRARDARTNCDSQLECRLVAFRDGTASGRRCPSDGRALASRAHCKGIPGTRFTVGACRFRSPRRRRTSDSLRGRDAGRIPPGESRVGSANNGHLALRPPGAVRCRPFGFTCCPTSAASARAARRPPKGVTSCASTRTGRLAVQHPCHDAYPASRDFEAARPPVQLMRAPISSPWLRTARTPAWCSADTRKARG